jgi:hypothetical protein
MTNPRRAPGRPVAAQDVGNLQVGSHRRLSRRRLAAPRSGLRSCRADW